MLKETDIAYEFGNYWVFAHRTGRFDVYKNGATHSTRCAQIGKGDGPRLGFPRAKAECLRRTILDGQKLHPDVAMQAAIEASGTIANFCLVSGFSPSQFPACLN
jgi:hypothetical protein